MARAVARAPRLSRSAPTVALTAVVGIVLATQLQLLPDTDPAIYLLAGPAALVACYLALLGPHWCLLAFLALTITGGSEYSAAAGPVDIRPTDVVFVALAGWAILLRQRGQGDRIEVGQRAVGVLLAVLAISLFPVLVRGQGGLTEVGVSWGRLLVTALLVWLAPYGLRTAAQRRFVFVGLLLTLAAQIAIAILVTIPADGWEERAEWGVGPNQIGLYAAVLIVAALHAPVPEKRSLRLLFGVMGVLGLMATRSIGATAATGLALGIFGLFPAGHREALPGRGSLAPLRLALLIVGVISIVSVLRPFNLPGSTEFGYSTTAHRIVVASGGLELFRRHPVLGVGWQRSHHRETIGSREVADALRRRFPNVNPEFYTDVKVASVHNTYIQFLAESGVIGAAAAVALFVVVRRRIRWLLRALGDSADGRLARTMQILLVVILIWCNDNPLYGAEPETVMAAIFLGLLAAFRPSSAELPIDPGLAPAGSLVPRPG